MEASVTTRAPAKLNLTLEVLARRADGLHGMRSLMVPIDLADELTFSPAERFAFSCDVAELREDNLAERAARALPAAFERTAIALRKAIPVRAGLGGGSTDAATVLLYALGRAELPGTGLLEIARSLGSDVPFFLAQTGALVEGTGERVTPAGALPPWHAVVVAPPTAISTKEAYAALDSHERPTRPRNASASLEAVAALQRREFETVERLLCNDFERVAYDMAPECALARDALREAGASNATLAGSGACVFTLLQTCAQRDALASRLHLPAGYQVHPVAFASAGAWRAA